MPEPGSTRRVATARRATQEDIPTRDANRKSSYGEAVTIEDRIRKWQTHNNAEAVDPDVLSVRSQPRSEALRTPTRSRSPDPIKVQEKEAHSTPRRRSTKWVQQENKSWVKQRRSVRGDQRKNSNNIHVHKVQKMEKAEKIQTPPRAESPMTEFIRTDSQKTRNVNSSRAERDQRRRRREARARADGGNALVNDGIRVYMKSESHLASEPGEIDKAQSPVDEEKRESPEHGSELSLHHNEPVLDEEEVQGTHQNLPSKYAQTLGRTSELPEDLDLPKTRKRAILTKTKEIFAGRHDLHPAPSNRIPSIEAWLEEQPDMPDPFVDNQSEISSRLNDAPKPFKNRSHRKKVSIEPTILEVDDPNKIWDSINHVKSREERKNSSKIQRNVSLQESETSPPKRRLFSFEVCDEPTKGEESSIQPPEYTVHDISNASQLDLRRKDVKSTKRKKQLTRELNDPSKEPVSRELQRENSIQPDRDISPRKKDSELSHDPQLEVGITEAKDAMKPERPPSTTLKRKLTTHEDLLSVLSQPRTRKSVRSVRGACQNCVPPNETVVREALQTMQEEEGKYNRELRTLVDGVTPVLLQSLLSRETAAATAGLFSSTSQSTGFTRPIIDMGVALQRLKTLHHRIPLREHNIEGLLTWAVTAHKSYTDYVKSWRLGFQGVIVNLAPPDESQMTEEEMLARDVDGDATDEQGQKVDVAYLQKRPLIRIKRLSKLFTTIRDSNPDNEMATKVADMYAELTETAKRRHSEEQGRLEDEAAANIDVTRARDFRTMAPLESIEIDKKRRVRARDYFDLSVYHSTGQRLDCRIELVLRDDPEPNGAGGDVLVCQVEEEAKWLLFQPILLSNISARRDQAECDLVLMVKGVAGIGKSWLEMVALKAEDPAAVTEWLHMLGSNPLPPRLNHTPSWHLPQEPSSVPQASPEISRVPLSAGALANLPSDVDVPIGEPSVISSRPRVQTQQGPKPPQHKPLPKPPQLGLGGGLQKKTLPDRYQYVASSQQVLLPTPLQEQSVVPPAVDPTSSKRKPSSITISARPVSISNTPTYEPLVPPQRYSPQKFSQLSSVSGVSSSNTYFTQSDITSRHSSQIQQEKLPPRTKVDNTPITEPLMSGALPPESPQAIVSQQPRAGDQPTRTNLEGPTDVEIERPSKHSRAKSSSIPLTDTIREQWSALSGLRKKPQSTPNTPERMKMNTRELMTDDLPTPRPMSRHESPVSHSPVIETESSPPPPPMHKSTYAVYSSRQRSPVSLPQSPQFEPQPYADARSPLKHQYQPSSSASGTESESDETDATSEISEDDFRSELKDEPTPLISVNQGNRRSSFTPARPLPSIPSAGTRTLDPSDSASNGPYRQAPPPSSFPAHKKKRTIALVCSWSDRGIWEPIKDDECSIVISPGLVQAFPMSAAHSQPMAGADWEDEGESSYDQQSPLVEFELTPVVPLRKGTALDITIRSPPTSNSAVRTTNNVMFRSRTVQECEKLYQLINWARCNNPTYAQLARSRAREPPVTFATNVPQSRSRSWFSFGSREKSSYRASSRPPTSIADTTTTSSSATSAFTALKRFGKNSPFSLKRSSVIRRPGISHAADSLYSSSNGGSGSGTSTPAPSQAGFVPGPEGPNVPQTSADAANGGGMVNNMKIRLFLRQGQKWEALGPSLLTVLPATSKLETDSGSPSMSTPPDRSRPPSSMPKARGRHFRLPSSENTPHRIHGNGREKRILVTTAKHKDVVLLDETLGESCFEKVMQTGIAVNVWKEDDEMQEYGGVMTGRSRMYMIQFRTSAEASWVFNMCGTYRYGGGTGT